METQSPAAEGLVAPIWFDSALHWIALWFEAAGVAVIVLGAVFAVGLVGRQAVQGRDWSEAYHLFRTRLARGILLGLEFLVAADIIGTVAVEPTLQNLSVLGLIVLIRTFLSFALELESQVAGPGRRRLRTAAAPGAAPGASSVGMGGSVGLAARPLAPSRWRRRAASGNARFSAAWPCAPRVVRMVGGSEAAPRA